ncbi:MAG TPA: sigma 54-interacting transcriptional regulator [Polyangia bacterium]|nr:sigma 54-interacting transcriptional regulator [Polyangia bacterium]
MSQRETVKDLLELTGSEAAAPVPGLALVWSGDRPLSVALPLGSAGIKIGRTLVVDIEGDERISRRHAQVTREAGRFRVTDLGSSNGTFVDGRLCRAPEVVDAGAVIRVGQTLFVCLDDVGPLAAQPVRAPAAGDDGVVGPRLARAFERIAVAARTSDTLLVLGESGTGKELAARRFHAASPRARGPFVPVNCATIPEGIAERLLFGARRGAFSGATADAEGYLVAADKGTLFLDELGELDPAVQPKLLRVLETREVIPLGDTRGRAVNVGICAATLRDIQQRVGAGSFREDLYYRMGRPSVRLPPLRERREEIPFLVQHGLGLVSGALRADVMLIEACLRRPWPGNVRELLGEARRAAHTAVEKKRTIVDRLDLGSAAGLQLLGPMLAALAPAASPSPSQSPASASASASATSAGELPPRERIEEVLRRLDGNVTRAAQELGLHRNQLRRWLARNQIDLGTPGPTLPPSPASTRS